jgi:hypothetical protein
MKPFRTQHDSPSPGIDIDFDRAERSPYDAAVKSADRATQTGGLLCRRPSACAGLTLQAARTSSRPPL